MRFGELNHITSSVHPISWAHKHHKIGNDKSQKQRTGQRVTNIQHPLSHPCPFEVFLTFPQDTSEALQDLCLSGLQTSGRQCQSSHKIVMYVHLLIFCIKNKYNWKSGYILPHLSRLSHIRGVTYTPL